MTLQQFLRHVGSPVFGVKRVSAHIQTSDPKKPQVNDSPPAPEPKHDLSQVHSLPGQNSIGEDLTRSDA